MDIDTNNNIQEDLTEKHYKDTFEKISEEKRKKILDVAVKEFASKGFSSANINEISKNAGISIGSMYTYFASKEDLFLTVMNYGYSLLEEALTDVATVEGDIFDKLEQMIRTAQYYSKKHREMTQIYLDITSEGLAHLSRKLSRKMETITAQYSVNLIKESQEKGLVAKDIDEKVFTYCIDNIILLLQFSYTTEYFRERMKIFAGENSLIEDERIVNGIMQFIRKALTP